MNLLNRTRRGGCTAAVFIAVIVIIGAIIAGDLAFIGIAEECMDTDGPIECIAELVTMDEEEKPEEGTVTAVGSIGDEKGDITFTLVIPLKGGAVTGSFDGDCSGSLKASFSGGNGGAITGGIGKGACAYVFPASGTFTGTVNTTSRTAVITGEGSIPGGKKSGSVTLTWSEKKTE